QPIKTRGGDKRIMFLQAEGDLFFGVADELRSRLQAVAQSGVQVVILRLKRTHMLDSTVLAELEQFADQLKEQDGQLILCGAKPDLMQHIRDYGLVSILGEENVFETEFGVFTSAKRALQRAREIVGDSIDADEFDDNGDDDLHGWAYQI
ncbi:MAG: sodium-independent anion transporter, partial [Phycisphaeraceae bacterium]|nr:sodium-independent anion transporter [Phycisphaeraceae bacterium]